MNHEIEHHGHVGPARIERGEPVALDESWAIDEGQPRAYGAIESLDVTDLHHRPRALRDGEQRVGFVEGRRHRLLDQHVQTALERGCGHLVVRRRRNDDAHRVDLVEQRLGR